jgi:hypothetical protein
MTFEYRDVPNSPAFTLDVHKVYCAIRQDLDLHAVGGIQEHVFLQMEKATTEADRRVLEAINKTKDEYTVRLDSLAQKNDATTTRNQELVDRIHAFELLNK